jgi:hypothetical protein
MTTWLLLGLVMAILAFVGRFAIAVAEADQ